MRGAIALRHLQLMPDVAVRGQWQPLFRDRRAADFVLDKPLFPAVEVVVSLFEFQLHDALGQFLDVRHEIGFRQGAAHQLLNLCCLACRPARQFRQPGRCRRKRFVPVVKAAYIAVPVRQSVLSGAAKSCHSSRQGKLTVAGEKLQ